MSALLPKLKKLPLDLKSDILVPRLKVVNTRTNKMSRILTCSSNTLVASKCSVIIFLSQSTGSSSNIFLSRKS